MTFLSVLLIIIAVGLVAESWWYRKVLKEMTSRLSLLEYRNKSTREIRDFRTWGPEHKKVEGETYDPPPVDMYEETKSTEYKKEKV